MDAELPSGKLEYGGASLGYLSFRQNVWTCCILRASCPEYCRAGKCSMTQVVPRQMECVASCRYSSAVLFRVLVSHFAAKIRLDFCSACASCPIGWRCPPENVLQVQSCTALDEEPDHFIMAASGSLVQRRRVGMASHRVGSIWIFARVKHQSDDLRMTKIRRQRKCQMAVFTGGACKQPTGI